MHKMQYLKNNCISYCPHSHCLCWCKISFKMQQKMSQKVSCQERFMTWRQKLLPYVITSYTAFSVLEVPAFLVDLPVTLNLNTILVAASRFWDLCTMQMVFECCIHLHQQTIFHLQYQSKTGLSPMITQFWALWVTNYHNQSSALGKLKMGYYILYCLMMCYIVCLSDTICILRSK